MKRHTCVTVGSWKIQIYTPAVTFGKGCGLHGGCRFRGAPSSHPRPLDGTSHPTQLATCDCWPVPRVSWPTIDGISQTRRCMGLPVRTADQLGWFWGVNVGKYSIHGVFGFYIMGVRIPMVGWRLNSRQMNLQPSSQSSKSRAGASDLDLRGVS